MAFDGQWFQTHIAQIHSAGEDKELEAILLRQSRHISYVESIRVYDEKIANASGFYRQRRREILLLTLDNIIVTLLG